MLNVVEGDKMDPGITQENTEKTGDIIFNDTMNDTPDIDDRDTSKSSFTWLRRMIIQIPLLIGIIMSLLFSYLIHHIATEEAEYFERIFLQQDIALANSFSSNPDFFLSQEHQEVFTYLLKGWTSALPSIESVTICKITGELISHYSIEE